MPGNGSTESDDSFPLPAHRVSNPDISDGHANAQYCTERALTGIKVLQEIDLHAVPQDLRLHHTIQDASHAISTFLESLTTLPSSLVQSDFSCLGAMLSTQFLAILFQYRTIFNRIGSQSLSNGDAMSAVVSWADVILAKLGEVIVTVATGFHSHGLSPSMPPALQIQHTEDILWAASQLPEQWDALPSVLSSEHTSPAAKRLSLRLLFGAHVMSRELVDPVLSYGPALAIKPDCDVIIENLLIYSKNFFARKSLAWGHVAAHSLQERLAFAMIVVLYAAAHIYQSSMGELDPMNTLLTLRPHSSAALLSLIQIVLIADDTVLTHELPLPHQVLDPAQTILIKWGCVVPWCWTIWDDARVADVEYLTRLTATWLYHLDSSPSGSASDHVMSIIPRSIQNFIMQDTKPCTIAFLRLLHHGAHLLNSNLLPDEECAGLLTVFKNLCMALDPLPAIWDQPGLCLPFCKNLCMLYVLLNNIVTALPVQEAIIGILISIPDADVHLALSHLRQDTKLCFVTKLDEAVNQTRVDLLDNDGSITEDGRFLQRTRLILNLLTFIWHNGMRGCLHTRTVCDLFTILSTRLPLEAPTSRQVAALHDAFVMSLAAAENLRSTGSLSDVTKVWQDDVLWQFSLRCRCSNLSSAAAFANYVLAANRTCNALRCAQAWSQLRDVLLLILGHHFLDENDEILALLISPVICRALVFLLARGDSQTVRFILCSPWTMTLCVALRAAIDGGAGKAVLHEEYGEVLKERLSLAGRTLLNQISNAVVNTGDTTRLAQQKQRLFFCRSYHTTRLVLAP